MLSPAFKDKLVLMTNGELRAFITKKETHSEEEDKAALGEAEARGIEIAAPPPTTESRLVLANVDMDPGDKWGKHQQVEDESAPLLYSKRAVYTFSFFFSVVFGAVLMILNLRALNKKEGVVPVLSFAIAYLVTWNLVIDLAESHFNFTLPYSPIVSYLGAWLILKFTWDKYIGNELAYRRRSVVVPVLIGIAISVLLLLGLFYLQVLGQ